MIYDAIVVGGGIAGLCATTYLADQGYQTLLLERSEAAGGLVSCFQREGFTFDRGVKALMDSGVIKPMLKHLGLADHVEFVPEEVCFRVKDRYARLSHPEGLEELGRLLCAYYPHEQEAIEKIVELLSIVRDDMSVIFSLEHPLFIDEKRIAGAQYFRESLLPWLGNYRQSEMSMARLTTDVRRYLSLFTSNRSLLDILTQHISAGTPTYFALSHFGYYPESMYPVGGTGRLTEILVEAAQARGAVVRTESDVQGLDADEHEVILSDGERIGYRKLIWAADQRNLYEAAKASTTPAHSIQSWQVGMGKGSDSFLTLHLALDLDPRELDNLCPHTFYSASTQGLSSRETYRNPDMRPKSLDKWETRVREYLELTTYDISCPVLRDPTLAPEGKTGITVSTLMDYNFVSELEAQGHYDAFRELSMRAIVDVLADKLLPGLQEKILFAEIQTPLDYAEISGSVDGAVAGWSFAGKTLPVEKRYTKIIRSVETPIEDVWQCGQWVYSPGDVPTAILTGKLAADQVAKSLKNSSEENP